MTTPSAMPANFRIFLIIGRPLRGLGSLGDKLTPV
jgi:hypothetical protein